MRESLKIDNTAIISVCQIGSAVLNESREHHLTLVVKDFSSKEHWQRSDKKKQICHF